MSRTYVHLGRNGDVINTLPLLHRIAQAEGRPRLVVAEAYASILDGVSYVEPVVWHGAFEDLREALAWTRTWAPDAVNLQVYGRDMPMPRHTASFVLEQWHRAGRVLEWGAPLVFDRRDATREAELVAQHASDLPLVLVATSGFSSPFAHGPRLLATLRNRLAGKAHVVDLSAVRCERIYDLLGLFDMAACLVCIDSAHMHLAHGSKVPVIALCTDGHTPWHRSPRRAGHLMHLPYSAYEANEEGIVQQALACARGSKAPLPAQRTLLHVYPSHPMAGDALRRHVTALRNWSAMYDHTWRSIPFTAGDASRSAQGIGDRRDLPYMHDMIAHAMAQATSDDDMVVVSNGDGCMVPDMGARIRRTIDRYGAFFTHRWDFGHPVEHVHSPTNGKWYPGSDVFGFSVGWWKQHGREYPDMIVGAEYVDCVLRQLIKLRAHPEAEIHGAVFHEKHESAWTKERRSPSNQHNKALALAWFAQHGTDDLDPFSPEAAQAIRLRRGATTP